MRAMNTFKSMSLVIFGGRVELSCVPATLSHVDPLAQ